MITFAAEPWSELPDRSIDYAVMKNAKDLSVMRYSGPWSDLDSWQAISQHSNPDEAGKITVGNSLAADCEWTMLRSESGDIVVVGVALRDVVAIATPEAVLVGHVLEAQLVRDALQKLKSKGARQSTFFHFDRRPWGRFETLAKGNGYHVK